MAKTIRYYLVSVNASLDGRVQPVTPLPLQISDRMQLYHLPGKDWSIARIRTESINHSTIAGTTGVRIWPRGRLKQWKDINAPVLKTLLTTKGVVIPDTAWPDEALDILCQFHQDQMGGYRTPWSRVRERRTDDDTLGAVEEV